MSARLRRTVCHWSVFLLPPCSSKTRCCSHSWTVSQYTGYGKHSFQLRDWCVGFRTMLQGLLQFHRTWLFVHVYLLGTRYFKGEWMNMRKVPNSSSAFRRWWMQYSPERRSNSIATNNHHYLRFEICYTCICLLFSAPHTYYVYIPCGFNNYYAN